MLRGVKFLRVVSFPDRSEIVCPGSLVRFTINLVSVVSCLKSPTGSNCFPPESEFGLVRSEKDASPPWRWKVSCSPLIRLHGPAPRVVFLLLRTQAHRLVLIDHEETVLDARYLLEGESIKEGISIDLSTFRVTVGERIFSDKIHQVIQDTASQQIPTSKVPPPSVNLNEASLLGKMLFVCLDTMLISNLVLKEENSF